MLKYSRALSTTEKNIYILLKVEFCFTSSYYITVESTKVPHHMFFTGIIVLKKFRQCCDLNDIAQKWHCHCASLGLVLLCVLASFLEELGKRAKECRACGVHLNTAHLNLMTVRSVR